MIQRCYVAAARRSTNNGGFSGGRDAAAECVCVGPRRPWPRPSGSSRYCAGRRFSLISFKIRIIRTRSAKPPYYVHIKSHIFFTER